MSNYVWPCDSRVVTSGFRTKERPSHNGADLANIKGAGNVYAFADGVVTAQYHYNGNCYNWGSGNIRMGNALFIKHDRLGLRSDYQHLASFASGIKIGSVVKKGQIIGVIGNTGASLGAHLHFGLHNGRDYINPMTYLNNADTADGGATEGVQKMKVLDVFASITQAQTGAEKRMNVQGFEKPDVNSKVLTDDAAKGLADGRYWVNEVIATMGNLSGYSGARIQVGDQQMWVSILPGATELTDMSAEDAYKRYMQKGSTGYTEAELNAAVAAATAKTKEQLATEQKARQDAEAKIKAAQVALG